MNPEMEGFSNRRSSCLLFQVCSVEMHSFLPHHQSDGGDLARQSQTRHRWFHPFGNQGRVELLERSGDSGGPNGRTLEDIFQIVIMVFVEPADGHDFLGAFELAMHNAIFPAVAGFQGQAAVAPQLSLGAEPVWRLDEREQQSCTDRSYRWDLAQQLCCVSCSRPITLAALAGARAAVHRTVDSKAPPGGARRPH